ncbi:uncharacterized protein LOC118701556 isoform X4 [Molothrus ater]|uniref:uncharacterized protein LOC118701556 isoform X4 n=1 Tax=Molothrus ater TaxID=84834 RepID=UPI0023E85594|nr:uncharacterized protein LOC118701556 isoform X4 [Molothrus ater]
MFLSARSLEGGVGTPPCAWWTNPGQGLLYSCPRQPGPQSGSPSESFLQFIDRLRAQVERRVRDPKTKMEIVKEMAQRNANEVCSRVLLGLPLNPPPTLAEMMEACARKVELFAAREAWSRLKNPETVVAVSPGVRRSTQWTVIGVDLPEDLQNLTKDRTKLDITIGDPRLRRTIITW